MSGGLRGIVALTLEYSTTYIPWSDEAFRCERSTVPRDWLLPEGGKVSGAAVWDAKQVLGALVGQTIHTLTGRPNKVLAVGRTEVIVGTGKSPSGQAVPLAWVQDALDRLAREGEIEISVESVGYRSAFIGAVLATLPNTIADLNPRRIRLTHGPTGT